MRPSRGFLVVECLKIQLGKLALKSVDGCYAWFSTRKINPPFRGKAYLYVSHLEAFLALLYKSTVSEIQQKEMRVQAASITNQIIFAEVCKEIIHSTLPVESVSLPFALCLPRTPNLHLFWST